MDPLFESISYFRRRKFDKCSDSCTAILQSRPYDQAAWILKTRAWTQQTHLNDVDDDEDDRPDSFMNESMTSEMSRPGTTFRTGAETSGQAVRPSSRYSRSSATARPLSQVQGRQTPRTARPISASLGRAVRLGTASMLSDADGPFINVAHLNLAKYATQTTLSKPLFEYIYHHENDFRHACELASQATKAADYKDWWWNVALGRCYRRMNMNRDAEKQFKTAFMQQPTVEVCMLLARVYVRLDQPVSALDVLRHGLDHFPGQVRLLNSIARIHEDLGDLARATRHYQDALHHDATSVEAMACIGFNHFYADQPEVAIRFYRRLLQMGIVSAQIFNNLGLCCFYAQQYDTTLTCFQLALLLADDVAAGEVWYNQGVLALGMADSSLAQRCFRLALASDHSHAEAYNNLAVLELNAARSSSARSLFQTASSVGSGLLEPRYNTAALFEQLGDLQSSFVTVQQALDSSAAHGDSRRLLHRLRQSFCVL